MSQLIKGGSKLFGLRREDFVNLTKNNLQLFNCVVFNACLSTYLFVIGEVSLSLNVPYTEQCVSLSD